MIPIYILVISWITTDVYNIAAHSMKHLWFALFYFKYQQLLLDITTSIQTETENNDTFTKIKPTVFLKYTDVCACLCVSIVSIKNGSGINAACSSHTYQMTHFLFHCDDDDKDVMMVMLLMLIIKMRMMVIHMVMVIAIVKVIKITMINMIVMMLLLLLLLLLRMMIGDLCEPELMLAKVCYIKWPCQDGLS